MDGRGRSVDCFVLQSFTTWRQCLNNFAANCSYHQHILTELHQGIIPFAVQVWLGLQYVEHYHKSLLLDEQDTTVEKIKILGSLTIIANKTSFNQLPGYLGHKKVAPSLDQNQLPVYTLAW